MNTDTKNLQRQTWNQIQQYIKRTLHDDKVGPIIRLPDQFNIWKSVGVIHHVDMNHATISVSIEKALDIIQYPF